MPFDPPMAEPVPTRRSSRRPTADSATAVNIEDASPAAPTDIPAAPLSRRGLRATRVSTAAEQAAPSRETRRSSRAHATAKTAAREDGGIPSDGAMPSDGAIPSDGAEDAFVSASRAFSSTAPRTPDADPSSADGGSGSLPRAAVSAPAGGRRPRGRFLAAGATIGVMGVAGLLAVSMTLPAEALAAAQGAGSSTAMSLVTASKASNGSSADEDEIQAYVASSGLQNNVIQRSEGFSTASLIDLATEQGIAYSNTVYTNDPDAAIQWPFIVGVGMSYGYGMRDGTLHEGLDLLPGAGAPVQAIAGGKVRIATESGGNYGVTVYIDHLVDGELITSHYSHMQYGSLQVEAGETVEVGDIIGKVGNTGRSYGAHMHFELIVDGSTIDPLPWLNENAGRHEGVSPVS